MAGCQPRNDQVSRPSQPKFRALCPESWTRSKPRWLDRVVEDSLAVVDSRRSSLTERRGAPSHRGVERSRQNAQPR